MPENARSLNPNFLQRLVTSILVVASIALTLRLVAEAELLSASVATVVALGCAALGLWLRGRRHSSTWRGAWALLALALTVQALLALHSAVVGFPGAYPVTRDWVRVLCALVAMVGLGRLLSTRASGRAMEIALEALLLTLATLFLPWVWAVSRGISPAHAAAVLVPVAAWTCALWMLARLVFLTKEHISGYLYLGAAFVCLIAVNAAHAGSSLQGIDINRSAVFGLTLWAYCLWGVAALHPSMSQSFEPAAPRSSGFGVAQLLLCGFTLTAVPVSLVVVGNGHGVRDDPSVLAGAALIPLVLAVYLVRQIRDRARAEYRAQHDPLTGLPNRTLFNDRVEVALAHGRRSESGVAVMFLDLDRFKSINDSLGHAVGNQLLQAVAKRLCDAVREVDTVARMGGDEFTILLHGVNSRDDAAVVADKIAEQFSLPFNAGGRELHTSTSIGIALFPSDGEDVESLLKHADSAMYRAKACGRDTYEFFTRDMSVQAQARLSVESGLRSALDRRSLELHYQPQIDVVSGQITGLEALARWPHDRVGMVMPNVFVPIAEETGLIVPLGEWAIDRALNDLHQWLNAGIRPRPIAVNVSARQLSDPSLADKVATALRRHDIPAHLLVLEITESVFVRDLPRSTATLRDLRELGVGCSIDDFGTGFSGLSYLADMSIDTLKIDRSFVAHVQDVHDFAPIIEAIIGLANGLQLEVVAEGVETLEQVQFLTEHGCTRMQGYYFSRPRSFDEVTQVLERDDQHEIAWLTPRADAAFANVTGKSSALLAALCSGIAVEENHEQITRLLAALVPADAVVASPSALRTMSMRVAAGSFAGLLPISTGLAAAHVLPNQIQSGISATLRTVGVELPATSNSDTTDPTLLIAGGQASTNVDDTGARVEPVDYTAPAAPGNALPNSTRSDRLPNGNHGGNKHDGKRGIATPGTGTRGSHGGNGTATDGGGTAGPGNPGPGGGNGNPGGGVGVGNPGNGTPGNGNPGGGVGNGNPGNGTPGTGTPGNGNPGGGVGVGNPGNGTPGTGTPGNGNPGGGVGVGNPGNGTPGNGTPGNGTPGNGTPGNGTPGNGTPGNGNPGGGVGNGNPGNGTPGNGNPGGGTPGNGTPGNGNPGGGTPGNGNPGGGTPGNGNPGGGTPGNGNPGGGTPGNGNPGTGGGKGA